MGPMGPVGGRGKINNSKMGWGKNEKWGGATQKKHKNNQEGVAAGVFFCFCWYLLHNKKSNIEIIRRALPQAFVCLILFVCTQILENNQSHQK